MRGTASRLLGLRRTLLWAFACIESVKADARLMNVPRELVLSLVSKGYGCCLEAGMGIQLSQHSSPKIEFSFILGIGVWFALPGVDQK